MSTASTVFDTKSDVAILAYVKMCFNSLYEQVVIYSFYVIRTSLRKLATHDDDGFDTCLWCTGDRHPLRPSSYRRDMAVRINWTILHVPVFATTTQKVQTLQHMTSTPKAVPSYTILVSMFGQTIFTCWKAVLSMVSIPLGVLPLACFKMNVPKRVEMRRVLLEAGLWQILGTELTD